jgi:hypothetical protein
MMGKRKSEDAKYYRQFILVEGKRMKANWTKY